MANDQTLDFTLSFSSGWNNVKTMILANGAGVEAPPSYKWSMISIANPSAAILMRRTPLQSTAPTITRGKHIAINEAFVFDARLSSPIQGDGIWINAGGSGTFDLSVLIAGN